MSLLQNSNAIETGGYNIANSLRFQSASTQYLSRTFSSGVNEKTSTLSMWVKRGTLGSQRSLMSVAGGGFNECNLYFGGDDKLAFQSWNGSSRPLGTIETSAVFRDPSSWYHIVFVIDTGNATSSERLRFYVNGTRQDLSVASYPSQNATWYWNGTYAHRIGAYSNTLQLYMDGYMTEINFIDGQALTPSSFGETNTLTGQWVAKKYTGTYGNNGFYLPFSNGTSTTTLGADSSGNGNNWTLTNFTRSAGVSDCWMYDVPSGNGGVAGTQPSSNYCVLNPLDNNSMTLSGANLNAAGSTTYGAVRSSFALSSGKWYYEVSVLQNVSGNFVGIAPMASVFNTTNIYPNALAIDNTTIGGIKTVGVTIDFTALECKFYVNNVLASTQTIVNANAPYSPFVADGSSGNNASYSINFGQRSFAYTPPSGFKALCTANLPAPTIAKGNQYMDATLYTGNGGSQTITNAGSFQPDFVWTKARSAASSHQLYDAVRGVNIYLKSNSTDGDVSLANTLTSFNSNGFTVGANDSGNQNTVTAVAWQWQAGKGTTSSNTSGSITSTVSVSTTAGFSIVTYTGTGANATVGHGLGVRPNMVIIKQRTASSTTNWAVYHDFTTNANWYLQLNTTSAQIGDATVFPLPPTSSVVSLGTNTQVNANNGTYVAYCFANITGFSKFGSYTGNGSADGPFVYCGFRPKFVMIKRTDGANDWFIQDTSRSPYNVVGVRLEANLSDAEASDNSMDILSNGFKLRGTTNGYNGSTFSYIYMAFAENPLAQSNAR